MRTGVTVHLDTTDRKRVQAIINDRNSPQKHVWRAKIVLATGDGLGTAAIMSQAGVSKTAVWRWQERFMAEGVAGLLRDKTRPARIAKLADEVAERVVALTLGEPPGETTQWTGRAMADVARVSLTSVQRIWKAHGLAPHRMRTFKLSNDPKFAAKVRDIVGLYVDPPAHALVLSLDEKSQIQALDRTQPGLPMKKGRAGTMTHDYKRHGVTTLFAAFNVLDGKVIGRCMQRHRHQEFIRFLNAVEREVAPDKAIHVILDNYATHKHAKVVEWLGRHPRWTFHFTPTSASWLNAVEGFFAILSKRRLKRGVFRGVVDLQAAINRFLADHNLEPKPFIWKADPEKIIAAAARGHQTLESIHSHVRPFKLQARLFFAC
jgi:transposase